MRFKGLLTKNFSGDTVRARAMRSTLLTMARFGGSSLLRLISNLILTRVIFPEAFGLMALVQVFIYGLQMFSDVGIRAMLIHHKQGGERNFLNVLWTLQLLRGVGLWIFASLIALPLATLYDQPELAYLLPIVAFSQVIEGFKPTKEIVANRELKLERVVVLQLVSQVVEISVTIALALLLQSVWALVCGLLLASLIRVVILRVFLPGDNDRLSWDRDVVRATLQFGVFVFFSTVASFFVNMGNRMVLGAYVDLTTFGVFSIAVMIGNIAGQVSYQVARTVITPLYRMKPPDESRQNQKNLFKARRMMASLQFVINAVLALLGIWLIDLMYDDRYAAAGPMVTLIAIRTLLSIGMLGSQEALLGRGDSKSYFYLMVTTGAVMMALLVALVPTYGVIAAILVPVAVSLLTYPLRAWLVHRHKAWDPVGELGFMALGALVAGCILYFRWSELSVLLG